MRCDRLAGMVENWDGAENAPGGCIGVGRAARAGHFQTRGTISDVIGSHSEARTSSQCWPLAISSDHLCTGE
jgi:hypothetical protein